MGGFPQPDRYDWFWISCVQCNFSFFSVFIVHSQSYSSFFPLFFLSRNIFMNPGVNMLSKGGEHLVANLLSMHQLMMRKEGGYFRRKTNPLKSFLPQIHRYYSFSICLHKILFKFHLLHSLLFSNTHKSYTHRSIAIIKLCYAVVSVVFIQSFGFQIFLTTQSDIALPRRCLVGCEDPQWKDNSLSVLSL